MKMICMVFAMLMLSVVTFAQERILPDNPVPKESSGESVSSTTNSRFELVKPAGQTPSARVWYKDPKALFVGAFTIGATLIATKEAHDCRLKFGPAPCDGGYGEFKAREIVRGVGSLGLYAISLWGRHQGFKEWPLFATGYATYNTTVAIRQARIGCPVGQHFLYGTKYTCVDNYGTGTGW